MMSNFQYSNEFSRPESIAMTTRSQSSRKTFESGSVDMSERIYTKNRMSDKQHQEAGGYIKTITLGGLDGCLTAFSLISTAVAGGIPWQGVLAMGFANIFANAFSMGIAEFLSEKAEVEYILKEKERKEHVFDTHPEDKIYEMIKLYKEQNMDPKDAQKLIETLAKYRELFIDVMMVEELDLQIPSEDWRSKTCRKGVVMFFSFLVFGIIPLLGYIILPAINPFVSTFSLLLFAIIITIVTLFLLGALRGITGVSGWLIPGLETVGLGVACACVAYGVCAGIKSAFGDDYNELTNQIER